MLEISGKKLSAARYLIYGGVAGVIIIAIITSGANTGWSVGAIIGFALIAVGGEQWIRALYKCPKCGNRLLPWRHFGFSTLEKTCPEHCPKCGERIIVKIVDNKK